MKKKFYDLFFTLKVEILIYGCRDFSLILSAYNVFFIAKPLLPSTTILKEKNIYSLNNTTFKHINHIDITINGQQLY